MKGNGSSAEKEGTPPTTVHTIGVKMMEKVMRVNFKSVFQLYEHVCQNRRSGDEKNSVGSPGAIRTSENRADKRRLGADEVDETRDKEMKCLGALRPVLFVTFEDTYPSLHVRYCRIHF